MVSVAVFDPGAVFQSFPCSTNVRLICLKISGVIFNDDPVICYLSTYIALNPESAYATFPKSVIGSIVLVVPFLLAPLKIRVLKVNPI